MTPFAITTAKSRALHELALVAISVVRTLNFTVNLM